MSAIEIVFFICWAIGAMVLAYLSIKFREPILFIGFNLIIFLSALVVGKMSEDHTPVFLTHTESIKVISEFESPKGYHFFYQSGDEYKEVRFTEFEDVTKIKAGARPLKNYYFGNVYFGFNKNETKIELNGH